MKTHKLILMLINAFLLKGCLNFKDKDVIKDFDSFCEKNRTKKINEKLIIDSIGKPDKIIYDSYDKTKKFYFYFNQNKNEVNTGIIEIDSLNICTCVRLIS